MHRLKCHIHAIIHWYLHTRRQLYACWFEEAHIFTYNFVYVWGCVWYTVIDFGLIYWFSEKIAWDTFNFCISYQTKGNGFVIVEASPVHGQVTCIVEFIVLKSSVKPPLAQGWFISALSSTIKALACFWGLGLNQRLPDSWTSLSRIKQVSRFVYLTHFESH